MYGSTAPQDSSHCTLMIHRLVRITLGGGIGVVPGDDDEEDHNDGYGMGLSYQMRHQEGNILPQANSPSSPSKKRFGVKSHSKSCSNLASISARDCRRASDEQTPSYFTAERIDVKPSSSSIHRPSSDENAIMLNRPPSGGLRKWKSLPQSRTKAVPLVLAQDPEPYYL